MKSFSPLVLLSVLSSASASVLVLTDENFSDVTAGKTVFIKAFAPWCGHCKAMAQDWEKLANDYAGHDTALVAELDCTSDFSDEICDKLNVESFPTLLFGDPEAPEEYQGMRDYKSMASFASEFITKPVCSIEKKDFCSPEEKAAIEEYMAKSKDDLMKVEAEVLAKLAAAAKELEEFSDEINKMFEAKNVEVQEKMAAVKEETKYRWVKSVLKKVHGIETDEEEMLPEADFGAGDSDVEEDDDDDQVGDEL